jgi:nicotinamidase-related amidase
MNDAAPQIDPQRTALLVMDVQPGIVGMLPDGEALVARLVDAIATARAAGAHVGYVRVAFEDTDYAAVPPMNKAFARLAGGGVMRADAPETQIADAVAPQQGDIVVRKVRVGAFSTTDLGEQLQARGIDTLILSGISTSGVVLSTVRDAADQDYRLVVLADGCGDPDEEVHRVLTEKVFPRQGDVIAVADLAALLEG